MDSDSVFIGIGSNLDEPVDRVMDAIAALHVHPGINCLRASPLYRSEPWGDSAQPDFINAVVGVRHSGSARGLLRSLLDLERQAGRQRDARRWGPRILDLDLLAYGQQRVQRADLIVPHPRIAERRFVLQPWADIAPTFDVPGLDTVARLVALCTDTTGVERLGRAVETTDRINP